MLLSTPATPSSYISIATIMRTRTASAATLRRRGSPMQRHLSSSSSSSSLASFSSPHHRRHLVFGANTDVGKTIVAAGLVRTSRFQNPPDLSSTSSSALNDNGDDDVLIQYIKPMQCGGSDERFVQHVVQLDQDDDTTSSLLRLHPYQAKTLVDWETPASPHTSSRVEGLPVSDAQILQLLHNQLGQTGVTAETSITWCETAGGVLSPGPSSPENDRPWHARQATAPASSPGAWGWQPQADLYQCLAATSTTVLVGDARLGGISATLSSLESLLWRGYRVPAIVVINPAEERDVHANAMALREYASAAGCRYHPDHPRIEVVDLPAIPPDPTVPLDDWYRSDAVVQKFAQLEQHLQRDWHEFWREERAPLTPADTGLALSLARTWSTHGRDAFENTDEFAANEWMDKVLGEIEWAYDAKVETNGHDAVAWAKQAALATYQTRMRVTEEQKESMEWAICQQSGPGIFHSAEDQSNGDGTDDETGAEFSWVSAENLVLDPPTLAFRDGKLRIRFPEGLEASPDTVTEFESIDRAMDIVARRISPKLYSQYKELIEMQWLVYEHSGINRKIGAVLLEPVLSRDHVWVDPLWQRALIEIGEARNIPIIYDETGIDWRMKRGHKVLHVDPDVAILKNCSSASKSSNVTTLFTEEVHDCATAEDAEDEDEDEEKMESQDKGTDYLVATHQLHLQNMSKSYNSPQLKFAEEQIRKISELDRVEECFALGNVLSIHTNETSKGTADEIAERAQAAVRQFDVVMRVDGSRIIAVVDPFLGREERWTFLEEIRQQLE